ncbi:MAG: cysteine desulfurase [Firmicutes bacterium]|jgi:cysteine desulfurase|nr:cysteine desulfurase [Bacillota bacterium]
MPEIYLDNSATTRPLEAVIELMQQIYRSAYGNPSSLHAKGVEAERLLKEARARLASLLNSREDEIIFTSGGTESNNQAIKGAALRHRRRGNHIITTAIEHPSVLNSCRYLESLGFKVTYLPVDSAGYIDLGELQRLVGEQTVLVTLAHVNSEIGTIQPLREIGAIIKERNPATLFHVDGVQSFGKLPVDLAQWQADLFSFSSHKIHGPKGVGALWVKRKTLLQPLLHGGDQEGTLRPGTENVPGIAGFGLAAVMAAENMAASAAAVRELKQLLYRELVQAGLEVELNGPPLAEGSPYIINLSFRGVMAETLLHALEGEGVFASSGSACHSRRPEPSHVLQAIGVKQEGLTGALRFSFSRFNTTAEVAAASAVTAKAVRELFNTAR